MTKWVYRFQRGKADGNATMKGPLGNKGAQLSEMGNLNKPIPAGFAITADACRYFQKYGKHPDGLVEQVEQGIAFLEEVTRHRIGSLKRLLMVSVRSSGEFSSPGAMDSILNVLLNDATVKVLAKRIGVRAAWDCYRRLIQMMGSSAFGIKKAEHEEEDSFGKALGQIRKDEGVELDADISVDGLKRAVQIFKQIVEQHTGKPFPQDPREQLWIAIEAVYRSWNNPRAVLARKFGNIRDEGGLAVIVQFMVFGNTGTGSGTAVVFTRDKATGERTKNGEFIEGQGEDVVSGKETPLPLVAMKDIAPQAYDELFAHMDELELHYRYPQDMEVTVENGKLYILQTRALKPTAPAAIKIATDLVHEGLRTPEEAVGLVDPESLRQLLTPVFNATKVIKKVLAKATAASPGAAYGEIVFLPSDAEAVHQAKRNAILVRIETSPEDIGGMKAAAGILTGRGGKSSHAAIVACIMNKPCVVGADALKIDYQNQTLTIGDRRFVKGDLIAIDGTTGEILLLEVPEKELAVQQSEPPKEFAEFMGWVDSFRRLKVHANAETPTDVRNAIRFGAEGVGLARTEHMFFEPTRIAAVREMILASDSEGRKRALEKILPMQRDDFRKIFTIMDGLPVTIRFLDPPLHEFLPHTEAEINNVAWSTGLDAGKLRQSAHNLQEQNPMLGFRGVRILIAYPEITDMQARAVLEGATHAYRETGVMPHIEIMVPLVFSQRELALVKERIDMVAGKVAKESGMELPYRIGSMIELPVAALRAGEIAQLAEFVSFGTNDLTQTGLGVSRDDASKFLRTYVQQGILPADPFDSIEQIGIGELVELGFQRGRAQRPDLTVGVCGEHGGNPKSIEFFDRVGIDYVSCSPFRVWTARLAAAQAAIKLKSSQTK